MQHPIIRLRNAAYTALILLFPICMSAQLLQVKQATKQGWAGGICCSHGTIYQIQLRITQPKARIAIDSLWLDGLLYAMPHGDEVGTVLTTVEDSAGTTLNLQVQFSWNEFGYNPRDLGFERKDQPFHRGQPGTDGVLFYHHRGSRHRFSLGDFKELPPIAYP